MSNPTEAETPTTEDVRDSYTVAWAGWDTTARYDLEAYAEFDRWLAGVKAAAWDEGAKWGAAEVSGDDSYETSNAFLVVGDNPYREKPRPECICYGYGIDARCNAHHDRG